MKQRVKKTLFADKATSSVRNKNLAIANRSRISCAHNMSRAWIQPAVSAYGADQALPLIDTIQ